MRREPRFQVAGTAQAHHRADGKPLYVAFLDLSNAFPSTNLPTLWLKLLNLGVAGPLLDWLRLLYAVMHYTVRLGGQYSAMFTSLLGVLIGDTVSPILWILYMADLSLPRHHDDVLLDGVPVSHIEQADDIVLFSTTLTGLQGNINEFYSWCCRLGFMTVNTSKSAIMVFGPCPPVHASRLYIGGNCIPWTSQYTYVGVTLSSVHRDIFAVHYTTQALKARGVMHGCFAAQAFTGPWPTAGARGFVAVQREGGSSSPLRC